jgi:hypothetical protein
MSRWWNWSRETIVKRSLVVFATLAVVVGFSTAAVAMQTSAAPAASVAGSTGAAVAAPQAAPPGQYSPHPGYLVVDEIAPGGATTEDPSASYDTVSSEPIYNTYETLVAYNGSTTATFSPQLSTCVPGTSECTTDYGASMAGFTGIFNQTGAIFTGTNGEPIYWTFPIDPAAKFYNPTANVSWGVYPNDVMFGVVRTMSFANLPFVVSQSGWIISQALLPVGSGTFDVNPTAGVPMHYPYNNTPKNMMSSMLINSSAFCPAIAISNGHGCITFKASGSGQDWPEFLQFVADPLGQGVEPSGWFSANSAGLPGWPHSAAGGGNGPTCLPGSNNTHCVTSTSDAAFTAWLHNSTTGGNATYWDGTQLLALNGPRIIQGNVVNQNLVGSGPYSAAVSLSAGYTLVASPGYAQPVGCSGATVNGVVYAKYAANYCDPAPGTYTHQVNVTYEPDDTAAISGFGSGTIDVGALFPDHTLTNLIPLKNAQKLTYTKIPTIGNFFFSYAAQFNQSAFNSSSLFSGEPHATIPQDFFSYEAARAFFTEAYPFVNIENQINTVGGLQFFFNAGGPIPAFMGDYYPGNESGDGCSVIAHVQGCNVTFPSGNPDTHVGDVGGAAWWLAQAQNVSSVYYDPELVHCMSGSCILPIIGEQGAQTLNAGLQQWITEIKSLTGNHIQPYEFDLSFTNLIVYYDFAPAGQAPSAIWNLGWAPDYPDPTDYLAAYSTPNAGYFSADAITYAIQNASRTTVYNNGTCSLGHSGDQYNVTNTSRAWANFSYWAWNPAAAEIPTACQGVALSFAMEYQALANPLSASNPNRTLYYAGDMAILNHLALYVWVGQQNLFPDTAPWINNGSLNLNPTIGGSQNQLWFHLNYTSFTPPATSNLTLKEVGLPGGTHWTVEVDGSNSSTANTSMVVKVNQGPVSLDIFNETSGLTHYAAAKIVGSGNPQQTGGTIGASPVTWTITFGALKTLFFNETVLHFQLYSGASWSVTINPALPHGGPASQTASSTGTSIAFTVPATASYKFVVTGPSDYKAAPASGAASVPAAHATLTKLVKFTLKTVNAKFHETGLPAHTSWTVTITSSSNPAILVGDSVTGTAAILTLKLPTGSYGWSATATGFPTQTGSLSTTYPTTPPTTTVAF